MTHSVRTGLFRTIVPGIGECARVDMRAGDAAPYPESEMYMLSSFEPAFDALRRRDRAGLNKRSQGISRKMASDA